MLQARRIGIDQEKKFIELLKDKPIDPIKIFVGESDGETDDYANEMKTMLDAANGKTNVIIGLGNERMISKIGKTLRDIPFFFVTYQTNDSDDISLPGMKITYTTPSELYESVAMKHYFAYTNSASFMFNEVNDAFQKIDMFPVLEGNNTFLKPGEWGIFIPKKF